MIISKPLSSVRRGFPADSLAKACVTLAAAAALALSAAAQSTTVVISQVYGGGGNSGAPFKNDFIELHNISGAAVSIDGWSLQYTSATGNTWGNNKTNLSGTIPSGGYFLIGLAAGTNDAPLLPTPDLVGTTNMSATSGKVALVSSTTNLGGTNPHDDPAVVDFVGFGSTANGFEGAGPTAAPSNATSVARKNDGALDTNDNSTDFEVLNPPFPRNSSYSSGPDETPPTIISLTPADDAVGVTATDTLSIIFSEPVITGSGNIIVMTGASAFATVPVGEVVVSGATATITLPMSLSPSTAYHVLIDSGAFEDLSENPFAGIADSTTWDFTTAAPDVTPPSLVSLTPADDATNVLPAANFVIQLDETVVAGSGSVSIFKTAGNELVEALDVQSSRVQIVDDTVFIDPEFLLEPSTSYYVTFPQGFVEDLAGNDVSALSGATTWSFTTRGIPALVISQYYEGANQDRYIELKNTSAQPLSLEGYRLAVWAGAESEAWKASGGNTDRLVFLEDLEVELPADSTYLIANMNAGSPAYAASSANAKNATSDPATFFSGTHSVVLYSGGFNEDPEHVIDAVSIVGSEGTDTSFYRLTDVPAFNFQPGSSILDDLGQAWAQTDLATVANADPADPEYLLAFAQTASPVLDSFVVANNAPVVVTPTATVNFTTSGGTAAEYMVSESPTFAGAEWTALPGGVPIVSISPTTGGRTFYLKLRNGFGESNVLSDDFQREAYTTPNTVILTQYYEGTANNKYIELTNLSEVPADLTGWTLARWTNAERENWKVAGLPASGTFLLSGVIEAGQTVVIANNQAATPVAAGSAFLNTAVLNHNGDDSIAIYEGGVDPANLRGVAGFAGNDGADRSFVRISEAAGFDFEPGTGMVDFPGVWQEFSLAVVNSAVSGQNEHLGTYGDSGPPGGSYAEWIAGFDVGGLIGPNDDFDEDGIPNAVENYFGTDPSVANAGISEVGAGPGLLNFQHPISATPASDLFGSYEWSLDLVTWVEAGVSSGGTTVDISVFQNAGVATVMAEASGTPAAKIFVRLNVE